MPNPLSIIVRFVWDLLQWCALMLRSRESLEAEILFLRRQLAMYQERVSSRSELMQRLEWR